MTAAQPITVATLDFGSWATQLRLAPNDWRPGQPHLRFDVIAPGAGPDWQAAAQAEADRILHTNGYTRTGSWTTSDGGYTAPIKETP